MYFNRFLLPFKHYIIEKFRMKRGGLFYMLKDLVPIVDDKVDRMHRNIDPERFLKEKRYMLFVLEKPGATGS
jgi:hypothetical protein